MPCRKFGTIIVCIALQFCPSAFAETKQYIVEVAVFDHQTTELSDEVWKQPYTELAQAKTPSYTNEIQFVKDGPMKAAVDSLRRRREYTLLKYSVWIQDTLERSRVPVVPISSAATNLEGYVQVYGGQLLFVDIALSLGKNLSPNAARTVPTRFVIDEKRRLKLDETHYFDHPYFGAILRVSRQP
ncbi:MAG: peptidoglycan binding protein CsiV [Gammaproteobacteria bacterium]|nr:peptidoglycan binding protein CsiV [Gammaproteobacteria bacterium]